VTNFKVKEENPELVVLREKQGKLEIKESLDRMQD
jgi:hypothetical protein